MRNYSKSVSTAIYFLPSPQNIIKKFYTVSVSAFSFYLKKKTPAKKANSGFHPETPATPHLSTQLAILSRLLGTFARKRAGA